MINVRVKYDTDYIKYLSAHDKKTKKSVKAKA